MQVEVFKTEDNKAEWQSWKTKSVGKIISYLLATQDSELIPDNVIQKMEIYDTTFIKFYIQDSVYCIDMNSIGMLDTHHFIRNAKRYKAECEKLWDIISPYIDFFRIEKWFVEKYYQDKFAKTISFCNQWIYVNGVSTGLPFNFDNYKFVAQHLNQWILHETNP